MKTGQTDERKKDLRIKENQIWQIWAGGKTGDVIFSSRADSSGHVICHFVCTEKTNMDPKF